MSFNYIIYIYIHLYTIGLIGVTELGTVTFHFVPNQRRWLVDFSVDIVASNLYFRQKFKLELKFICTEFQFSSTFNKYDIAILVRIVQGNRSLISYNHYALEDVLTRNGAQ